MPDTLEAEVLEIDGSPPPAPAEPRADRGGPAWKSMQGRVLKLDRRWWPLWVLLGIVALVLLLTVGVVVGVLVLIGRIVGSFLRLLTGGGGTRRGSGLSRRSL